MGLSRNSVHLQHIQQRRNKGGFIAVFVDQDAAEVQTARVMVLLEDLNNLHASAAAEFNTLNIRSDTMHTVHHHLRYLCQRKLFFPLCGRHPVRVPRLKEETGSVSCPDVVKAD